MKLIKPSWKILEQEPGIDGIYKAIERAGRTCYKSEDKITEDSAKGFVDRMIASGHGAMLEHGTVYLRVPYSEAYSNLPTDSNWVEDNYSMNPYSVVKGDGEDYYITSNYRVLVEQGWLDDLKYLCEPTEYHEKRITVHLICDRGVSHEFVRHRVFSFAQESTRYCNYSKDKFGNELTFISPCWTNLPEQSYGDRTFPKVFNRGNTNGIETAVVDSLRIAEDYYLRLLKDGWKPQQARAVLPNALKTELVMTGFVSDWEHFFKLRDDSSAHPQARELAHPLHMEFIRRGYIKDLYDETNPD